MPDTARRSAVRIRRVIRRPLAGTMQDDQDLEYSLLMTSRDLASSNVQMQQQFQRSMAKCAAHCKIKRPSVNKKGSLPQSMCDLINFDTDK